MSWQTCTRHRHLSISTHVEVSCSSSTPVETVACCSPLTARAADRRRRPSGSRRCSRRWPTRSGCGCSRWSPRTPTARPASATSTTPSTCPSRRSATTSRCCTRPGCSTARSAASGSTTGSAPTALGDLGRAARRRRRRDPTWPAGRWPSSSARRSWSPPSSAPGIAAQRLSPDDVGLQLLENSIATGAALVALILALQPVSAAFNPVVTLVERALGLVSTATAAVLVAAQVVGGARRRGRRQPDVRPRRGHRLDPRPRRRRPAARRGGRDRSGWSLVVFGSLRSAARRDASPSPSAATSPRRTGSPAPPASPTRP